MFNIHEHYHKKHILEYARQEANHEFKYFDWFEKKRDDTMFKYVERNTDGSIIRPLWNGDRVYKTEPNKAHPQYKTWLKWQEHIKGYPNLAPGMVFKLVDMRPRRQIQIINWGLDQDIVIVDRTKVLNEPWEGFNQETELWENGTFGRDENYVKVVTNEKRN